MSEADTSSALTITLRYPDPDHASLVEMAGHLFALGSLIEMSRNTIQEMNGLPEQPPEPRVRLRAGSLVVELINHVQDAWLVQVLALVGFFLKFGRNLGTMPSDIMTSWAKGRRDRAEYLAEQRQFERLAAHLSPVVDDVQATADIDSFIHRYQTTATPLEPGVEDSTPASGDPILDALIRLIGTLQPPTPPAANP